MEEICGDLDRRSFEKIRFEGRLRYGEENLVVEMVRHGEFQPAVVLSINSSDHSWARQALAQMKEEIEKGVPWWRWLHYSPGFAFLIVFVMTTFGGATALILGRFLKPQPLAYVSLFAGFVGTMIIAAFYQAIFPQLEIAGDDGKSSGTARIVSAVGLVVSIVVGVIVNRIS